MTSPADTEAAAVTEQEELERYVTRLRDSNRYRVLQRFDPPTRYTPDDGSPTATALAVDVETTGLDPAEDAIIQFCAIPFEYCRVTGRIFGVGRAATYLEDPGRQIPEEIVALTGLTDAMVAGQRIDDDALSQLLATASLVIAHNAAFDRRFVERRLPRFRDKPWACSQREVPWQRHGLSSSKLEFLMFRHCGLFYSAHSAEVDGYALIHLLATPLPSGESAMRLLLASARQRTVRIWALSAPFEQKDRLKARRYRWSGGEEGRPRAWYLDVPEAAAEAECTWLEQQVYGGAPRRWRREVYDACSRYSDRV
ncbi:MAG TPA: 3'-5' exonuclease [Gemmatimonadales bacterium]|nr:3'-5' exonuclease [Gemmatimonadales bacterium]